MLRRGAVLAWVAGLTLAPAAGAATVHGERFDLAPYGLLQYTAAPGEANQVTFGTQGEYVRLDDPGALITSNDQPFGVYCLGAAHTALCKDPDGFALVADLGDGDDSITTSAPLLYSTIYGGPGNDRLAGEGSYYGGPGADDMHGPNGGKAFYTDASGPVTVTLDDKPNDGVAGEGDNVHSDMSSVWSGPFDDSLTAGPNDAVLAGADGNDRIYGGPGDDDLQGGMGNDVIVGGRGIDRISGGPGDDLSYTRDGQFDYVTCGDGNDRVIADPQDNVDATCESRS